MIRGYCRTNLDDYDCSGIKSFVAIPNKGDGVQVMYKRETRILKVVSITHKCLNGGDTPYIEVELHL